MTRKSELVRCAQCEAMVRKDRLGKHMAKQHSLEASLAKSRQAERDEQPVECPHCKNMIKLKRLPGHIRKVHGIEQTVKQPGIQKVVSTNTRTSWRRRKPMKPKTEPALEGRFKSEREKNAFWRDLEAPEVEDDSVDVFDKRRVVLGGAYGLGKNRRH